MSIQYLQKKKKKKKKKKNGHFATSISLKFYYWKQIFVYSDLQAQKNG